MGNGINLTSGWATLWASFQQTVGVNLTNLLTVVGVMVVVAAILKWMFDRRRSGGHGLGLGREASGVWWAVLVGCALAAPQVIIPIFLTLIDAVVNIVLNVWNKAA